MSDQKKSTPMIICVPYPFAGAQRTNCCNCQCDVYEQAVNLKLVSDQNGFVICIACAALTKANYPEIKLQGQLWNGAVRQPHTRPEYQWLVDLLNDKEKKD
jgi:hypothetical protein